MLNKSAGATPKSDKLLFRNTPKRTRLNTATKLPKAATQTVKCLRAALNELRLFSGCPFEIKFGSIDAHTAPISRFKRFVLQSLSSRYCTQSLLQEFDSRAK